MNMSLIGIIANGILHKLSVLDVIVFESNPDYSCNTYPVFLEMRKRLPHYKMIWMTSKETPKHAGVYDVFYYDDNSLINKLKSKYYRSRAKALISCNRFNKMGCQRKGQVSLFLGHGSKTKKTRKENFSYCPGAVVDYINIQSHFFDEVTSFEYMAKRDQLVYLGYPRCDWFYGHNDINKHLSRIGVNGDYLIWLPTFRKDKSKKRDVHSSKYDSLGMPIIYTKEKLIECNNFLSDHNLHIIFKPHPAQDVTVLKKEDLSNIHIVDDKILSDIGIQLYQVIAGAKALISDYSSVFFDFLLLNKPIATTIDDIDQWKQGEGFAFDIERMYKSSTEQIANLDELYSFIQNVVIDNKDNKIAAREKICNETNIFRDGDSSKRVAEFIIRKIEKN